MPIYEYYCQDCHTKFERLRGFSHADDPVRCPNCHGEATQRALSTFFAFSKGGSDNPTRSLGGSPCASCAGLNCQACRL